MQIITRFLAKEKGLRRYFIGTPCKLGHVCERYVCNEACVQCARESFDRHKNSDIELFKVKRNIRSKTIRPARRLYEKLYKLKNREKEKERARVYQANRRAELLALRKAVEELKSTPIQLEDLL